MFHLILPILCTLFSVDLSRLNYQDATPISPTLFYLSIYNDMVQYVLFSTLSYSNKTNSLVWSFKSFGFLIFY